MISSDFATNQRNLSFTFTQQKNAELFVSLTGERYYDLLFNVSNEGLENSVLATIYHIPARLDSINVNDYYSSQITGLVNTVKTVWNYTGYQIQYWSGISGVTNVSGISGLSGYANISGGGFSGIMGIDLTQPEFANFSNFSGVAAISGVTGFLITGHLNPLLTGYVSGLSQATNWSYTADGVVSGFEITGYADSGNVYDVYQNNVLVANNLYEIKFLNSPPVVNFITVPTLDDQIDITESTGLTGYINNNYRVYLNGIEQSSESFFVQSGATSAQDSLFFYTAPGSGASILINEISGQLQVLNNPLSGQIDFTLNFDNDATDKYIIRSVDVYTGSSSGNYYDLSGFNLLKTVDFIVDAKSHTFSIFADEVLPNQNIYYKFIPRDDFDTGVLYTQVVTGYLFEPPQLLTFGQGIPPTLSFSERTNNFFSGLQTPAVVDGSDGALIYQVGDSGQNLYVLKSGQWKTIVPYEEITGIFAKYVSPPANATSSGIKGQFSISGQYLYAATGINQWGRVLLENW